MLVQCTLSSVTCVSDRVGTDYCIPCPATVLAASQLAWTSNDSLLHLCSHPKYEMKRLVTRLPDLDMRWRPRQDVAPPGQMCGNPCCYDSLTSSRSSSYQMVHMRMAFLQCDAGLDVCILRVQAILGAMLVSCGRAHGETDLFRYCCGDKDTTCALAWIWDHSPWRWWLFSANAFNAGVCFSALYLGHSTERLLQPRWLPAHS